jgi:hypothetical protein
MAQGHISLSISPFLVIYANTSKRNKKVQHQFGIFGSLFASTWFVFANQILFPISKSNTLVWANREIFQV